MWDDRKMMKLTVNYKDKTHHLSVFIVRGSKAENNARRISWKSILVVRKVVENIKLQLLKITQQLMVLTYFVNSALARATGTRRRQTFGNCMWNLIWLLMGWKLWSFRAAQLEMISIGCDMSLNWKYFVWLSTVSWQMLLTWGFVELLYKMLQNNFKCS